VELTDDATVGVVVAGEERTVVGGAAVVTTGVVAAAGVAAASVVVAVAASLLLFSRLILSISSSFPAELLGGCGTLGLKTGLGAGGGVSFFFGLFSSISLS
jgi:hypothetical protein